VISVVNRTSALAPVLYLASFLLAYVSPLGSTLLNTALVVFFAISIPEPGGEEAAHVKRRRDQ
jgi:hypothetical protein